MSLTLIALPDSTIDRMDRALWMTPPFSLRCLMGVAVMKLTLEERSPAFTLTSRPSALGLGERSPACTLASRSSALGLDERTGSLTLPRRDCD